MTGGKIMMEKLGSVGLSGLILLAATRPSRRSPPDREDFPQLNPRQQNANQPAGGARAGKFR